MLGDIKQFAQALAEMGGRPSQHGRTGVESYSGECRRDRGQSNARCTITEAALKNFAVSRA